MHRKDGRISSPGAIQWYRTTSRASPLHSAHHLEFLGQESLPLQPPAVLASPFCSLSPPAPPQEHQQPLLRLLQTQTAILKRHVVEWRRQSWISCIVLRISQYPRGKLDVSTDQYNLARGGGSNAVHRFRSSTLRTFLLIYPQHNHNLVPADTNELLYRSNTSPRQFREQDHSFCIVVFEL